MIPFQNPDIFIGSIRVQEPITVATDCLVVLACLFVFFKTNNNSNNKSFLLYRYFFLVTALSTLVSAIVGHAFFYCFAFNVKIFGWILGIASITCAQFAALYHTKSRLQLNTFKYLFWFNIIETLIAYILLFLCYSFLVVEIYSAIGLLFIVVPLETIYFKKTQSPLSKYMLIGIGTAVLAILCHILKIAYSVWFNHMDLAHIIMAISVLLMGKGLKREIKL